MVSESCRSPCLCIPMLGLQAHAAMSSILCGLLGFWTQVMIAKQAVLLNEPSPHPPKIFFFFKSLYWLRIKWGLDRELKYLWGKILQTYLCLYFFTTSYSLLPEKSHPGSNFNACTPRSQYPQISWKTLWKITDREITSCHSFGVSTQEENFLLSFDCSVLLNSGVD